MVKILADSTCDLSDELLKKYDVTLVPLHILLGEKEYRDRIEITPAEIYRWSDSNKTTPKTSAVSLEDAMAAMKPVADAGDEMVIFTISAQMSTTANVFRMAAEELSITEKVSVVDSANLSTGIGLLVIEAARMARDGKSREEIARQMETLKPCVRASFVVDTLVYLHRGGRCSSVAALMGGILKLHPRIVVKDGAMEAEKKYRGRLEAVILEYARDMEQDLLRAKKDRVFITHSGCPKEIVDAVYAYLEGLHHFDEILVTNAGGVISSHCGPGTLGVLFLTV